MNMLNKETVLNNFPCPSFRKHQKEVLEQIVEAVNSDYKCFLLDCPTGFGKSPLNIALGRSFENAYYITPQNPLIDQLKKDQYCGPYLTEIKGKRNYKCKFDENISCEVCLKKIKPQTTVCEEANDCPYQIQKNNALASQIMLTNFAYFSLVSGSKTFKNRELMIIDEAHNISEDIVKNMSIIISPHTLPKDIFESNLQLIESVKEKEDFTEYTELNNLLTTLKISCAEKIEANDLKLQTDYQNKDILEFISRETAQLKDFIHKIEDYENSTHEEHAYKVDKQNYWGKTYPRITLQPIYARPFMPKKVWNKAEYFILSSATMLDTDLYVQEAGLDQIFSKEEIKHISVPSTFPIENRPIINATVGKLTYETRDTILPLAIKRVEEILEIEKGNIAIHCHSYDNADAIRDNINPKYKERLISHDQKDRQGQLDKWKSSRNKVFLAVNFEEGQDWVGDICTAQILFKVPYPNLTDKRTRIRIYGKHESYWFDNETMKKVIQSYGRAVRNETDKANFYVIDFSFFHLIEKCKKIPEFFVEAPVKSWEDWRKQKTPTGEQVCGQCTSFESNCSHVDQVSYQPIKSNQTINNPSLVSRYSDVAKNCQNFRGI